MSEPVAALVAMLAAGYSTALAGKLVRVFPSFEAYLRAAKEDFDPEVFTEKEIGKLTSHDLKTAEKIEKDCDSKAIRLVTFFDPSYPPLLREIHDPPPVLFTRGNPLPDFTAVPTVSLVGTKTPTEKYIKFAALNGFALTALGFQVVSGFTVGIESYVHKGVLFGGGHPVSVLPCGLDVFPSGGDERVLGAVLRKGTLLSEYPPGYPVRLWSYAKRNRLVSGMTQGTVVVEASVDSGAISTAACAKEQKRHLFAVPSDPYEPSSEGNNVLIREGAVLVSSFIELAEDYNRFFGYDIDIKTHEAELKRGFAGEAAIVLTNDEVEAYKNSAEYTSSKTKRRSSLRKKPKEAPFSAEMSPADSAFPTSPDSSEPKIADFPPLSPDEEATLALLRKEPLSVDALCDTLGKSFPEAVDLFAALVGRGLCHEGPGGLYEATSQK